MCNDDARDPGKAPQISGGHRKAECNPGRADQQIVSTDGRPIQLGRKPSVDPCDHEIERYHFDVCEQLLDDDSFARVCSHDESRARAPMP